MQHMLLPFKAFESLILTYSMLFTGYDFLIIYFKGLRLNFNISNYNFYWLEWSKDQWTDNSNRVFGSPTYAFDIPIVYAHH